MHGHEGPAEEDVVEEGGGDAAGVVKRGDGDVAFEGAFEGFGGGGAEVEGGVFAVDCNAGIEVSDQMV